jgi:hypothetical protein
MEGADNMMSFTKRVTAALLLLSPYSDKYTPAKTPIGVLNKEHDKTIIKLPTMAFESPPPGVPGAGETCVNKSMLKAEKPLNIKMAKIQSKNVKPMTMADIDKTKPIKLARLRLA